MVDANDDQRLLQTYAIEGSEDAFTALVQRYLPLVYSAAVRQLGGDEHGAEDVAQMTFALLNRNARKLVTHPALSGWLYTTTFHLAKSAARKERRRRRREHEAVTMEADVRSDSSSVPWDSIRPVLDAAMLQLSAEDRIAVLFRYFEGKSYQEIGARLGLAENAARMRVDRALARLQRKLAKFGITSTAGAIGVALTADAIGAVPATLASSITAGATVAAANAGIFLLMSSTLVKVISGLALAGAVAGIVLQSRTISHQQAEILKLQSDKIASEDRLHREITDLQRRLNAATAAANHMAAGGRQRGPKIVHVSDILRDHPEYLGLMRKETRREVMRLFGPAIAKLNLPPDKLARLKDLLTERRLANQDFINAGVQEGLQPGTPEFVQARKQAVQDITAQISSLIGADGLAQLQYNRGVSDMAQIVTDNFQPDFIDAGVPLTPDQLDQVSAVLHYQTGNHVFAPQGISNVPDPTTWLSPQNNATLAKLAPMLTPAQLDVFKGDMMEANQRGAILASYSNGNGGVEIEP